MMLVICLTMGVLPNLAGAATPGIAVFVNGTKIVYKQAPVTRNGTTMVAAKETIEALGLAFSWDSGNKRIIAARDDVALSITLGEPVGYMNGVVSVLGAPAAEINGRVMVPLRFLTDGLGASIVNKNGTYLIQTANLDKSAYYSGLPLQITDTTVKNLGTETLKVSYVEYFGQNGEVRTLESELSVAPGQKGAFAHAATRILGSATIDYADSTYIGRAVKQVTAAGKTTPSRSYQAANRMYTSDAYVDKLLDYLESQQRQYDRQLDAYLKKELAANKNIPLRIDGSSISYDVLGYPEANIKVLNLTSKTIIAFDLSFSCYDVYGSPIETYYSSGNRFQGQATPITLEKGYTGTYSWDLGIVFSNTAKLVNIRIDKVAFSDGTVWKRK